MSPGVSPSDRTEIPRIAVVGCGAAAKEFCFPGLAKYPGFQRRVIAVDKNAAQAASVAQEFGLENHCSDMLRLPSDVDAAIVTTPHHLHCEQSVEFLRRGIPVFVEKPLGMSTAEATRMIDTATASGTTLMVNNCRRLFPAYCRVHELLRSGDLGEIKTIRISDGSPFDWNSVSGFYLQNASQARGVFLDRGAHTVDIVCWWLHAMPQLTQSHFDAMGGGEAMMNVKMMQGATTVELLFSRLFKLENIYTIECENAVIRGRLFQPSRFEVVRDGKAESVLAGDAELYHEYAWRLLDNFVEVVQGKASPLFTASDVAPSISLIDQAYEQAQPIEMPWYADDPNIKLFHQYAISHQS